MRKALASLLMACTVLPGALAQAVLQPSTTLRIDPGTTLRLPDGLVLLVTSGSALLNDGTIRLAPTASLVEQPGWPVTGQGVETVAMAVPLPPVGLEAGGLGLTIDAAVALDSLTVTRGHTVLTNTGGASGIARWYRTHSLVNSGLDAGISFRYDASELQGIPEAALAIHVATDGTTAWQGLPSVVDLPQRTVGAGQLDSLGTYTLFDSTLGTGVGVRGDESLRAGPVPAAEVLDLRDAAAGFRTLDVMDCSGRTVQHIDLGTRTQRHRLAVGGLSAGAYILRTDDGRTIRFVRP